MIIGTETIQQVTEHYIVQNEENEGRGEENAELLINYDNIDIAEKQNILEKIVKIMIKKTSQTTKIYKNDRARLKADIKLADDVIDSVQTSNITEDKKLVKCLTLVITQLLGIKETKNKRKEVPFCKRRTESSINALQKC